jgi:hypothetical protein
VSFERTRQYGVALAGALAIHCIALVALGFSISSQLPTVATVEPRIVAVAMPPPPPPDVEVFGAVDAPAMIPHFRPRVPLGLSPERQRRAGDPALAVWKYLCNRDQALGDAVRRDCPEFDFGAVDLSVRDPLNRQGDSGVIVGNDTATMSLDEVGRKKRWIKPGAEWQASGARAKANDLGIPGEDPFAILPK